MAVWDLKKIHFKIMRYFLKKTTNFGVFSNLVFFTQCVFTTLSKKCFLFFNPDPKSVKILGHFEACS